MMFWNRLRQTKLKFNAFSIEFKRCYNVNSRPIVANQHISSRTLVPILNNPKFIVQDSQLELFRSVRFYAAPVQANPKKEKKDTSGPRLNEEITAPTIRLVTDEDHYVMSRYEALARARSLKLDLVEVDRIAKPPVCKIFDYNKERYIQETKEKERAKSKLTIKKGCKEVRFAGKIKQNDLKIKAEMVKRLMDSGNRVKCTAMDPTEDMDLKTLLSRFTALIEDVAILESEPKYEKKQAFVVVRHVKFGPSKKGSGKKASTDAVSSETSGETREVGSGSEHVGSDEDVQTKKSEWAVFDGDDDKHPIFDMHNEEDGRSYSSRAEQSAAATGLPPYSADGNPRRIVESVLTNTTSSIPSGIQKPAMENRYARDPRSVKPPTPRIPPDMNGRGARNTMNSVPQMPNQRNMSPQMRPSRQVEVPKEDSSRSSNPNSPLKSYGAFSTPKVNTPPREQNAPAVSNRYMKSGPSDSARSPRTTGAPPPRDSPTSDSRMNRGLGADNSMQGRWGRLSSDNTNVIPNENENQAEIRRR